ncbi:hypothetical protein AB0K67_35070 [Nonomuraea sp. NPDC052634]|uniref:hypothetical protein n=1 Tax=Nonomuraea sp. NPDC052634 TaxID=3155813 RepID=UPI003431BCD2
MRVWGSKESRSSGRPDAVCDAGRSVRPPSRRELRQAGRGALAPVRPPSRRDLGQAGRGALAALSFAAAALAIYAIFSSGFGRVPRAAIRAPEPLPVPAPLPATTPPAAGSVAVPGPAETVAVVSERLWLTYLPGGLVRTGGDGGTARFASAAGGFVEARVTRGAAALDWARFRGGIAVRDARPTAVRGRPAVAGRHPQGGRMIAWLERPGTGVSIRVSESLGGELLALAASIRAAVGD